MKERMGGMGRIIVPIHKKKRHPYKEIVPIIDSLVQKTNPLVQGNKKYRYQNLGGFTVKTCMIAREFIKRGLN